MKWGLWEVSVGPVEMGMWRVVAGCVHETAVVVRGDMADFIWISLARIP